MLRVVTEATRRCEACGEPLPRIATAIFKRNEGCCPRCAFIHQQVGLQLNHVEIRDMSVRGKSSIAVPRIEFHKPGHQPKSAIPA